MAYGVVTSDRAASFSMGQASSVQVRTTATYRVQVEAAWRGSNFSVPVCGAPPDTPAISHLRRAALCILPRCALPCASPAAWPELHLLFMIGMLCAPASHVVRCSVALLGTTAAPEAWGEMVACACRI